jgi:predicted metalloprotease with PDZ domain
MKTQIKTLTIIAFVIPFLSQDVNSQSYQFSVNLKNISDDKVKVELLCPKLNSDQIDFVFPISVPGYYNITLQYGDLVSFLTAIDKDGHVLPMKKKSANRWTIEEARQIHKLQYTIDDVWEVKDRFSHWMPAENIFSKDTVFLINGGATFGYFEGFSNMPVSIEINYPDHLYPASGAKLNRIAPGKIGYTAKNYYELTDNPILFTSTKPLEFKVANADVIVSVYSTNVEMANHEIAATLKKVLQNIASYLSNDLPTNRYAFLGYFYPGDIFASAQLEHNNSAVFVYPENWDEKILGGSFKDNLNVTSYHEFFHILAPLNIHSNELLNFDFTNPTMSKHLWLYEGMTEYLSYHVQLNQHVRTLEMFCADIEGFVTEMKEYRSDVSLTEISLKTYGELDDEYDNVELKGVLVNLLLDIRLAELSKKKYSAARLMQDLVVKYGKARAFSDNELFDVIATLTYPEIRTFFSKYVEGIEPLPLKEYLQKIGLHYDAEKNKISILADPSTEQAALREYWMNH